MRDYREIRKINDVVEGALIALAMLVLSFNTAAGGFF